MADRDRSIVSAGRQEIGVFCKVRYAGSARLMLLPTCSALVWLLSPVADMSPRWPWAAMGQ
jgi:hypothetical protein